MKLDGVAAIVTGGASGLGAATAQALAAGGARVAVLDLNEEAARTLARQIGGVACRCDVASAVSAEEAVARAATAHGPARILVNCAGIAPGARVVGRNGPAALEDFERVVRINLVGTFNMIRLVAAGAADLEPLEEGERGVIVSTASVAAFEGQIGQAAYAASKAGVVGLTLPIARELAGGGIRVCAIAPGIFETPMVSAMTPELQSSLAANIPFPARLGRPDEFAALALAIVANPFLNGEVIRLDGAVRLQPR